MRRLTFLGAARTVTGSCYLVEADGERILVDCGMFQGPRELRQENWAELAPEPAGISALVLTHTHMDHIGRVPRLVKAGFRGAIFCTPPTRELAEILLNDAARLQTEDAAYLNRKHLTRHDPAVPLFDEKDVADSMRLFQTAAIGEEKRVSKTFAFTYRSAGHLLGAASAVLRVEGTPGVEILFSGDVGRFSTVLSPDPTLAPEADYMLVESTYGNRAHDTVPVSDQLETVLRRTFGRGGVVLIPAFAVGRAQQMIYLMECLVKDGRLPAFPVHVDSPMAIDATKIYTEFGATLKAPASAAGGDLFGARFVEFHRTEAASRALNSLKGPAVILSSSGMLTGGRILHHCSVRLPHPENTLLITGYQGAGTLGRSLLEGARTVRIHKSEIKVLAEVQELRGLSGHADAGEMLRWLSEVKRPPRRVFVTHGEEEAAVALAARIASERGFETYVPRLRESVDLP